MTSLASFGSSIVGSPKIEILVRVDRMLVGGERQARGEAVAGRRRAIEIVGFDGELERLAWA